jgi:uncharacterized glyoxalase superfamily protein PhnB
VFQVRGDGLGLEEEGRETAEAQAGYYFLQAVQEGYQGKEKRKMTEKEDKAHLRITIYDDGLRIQEECIMLTEKWNKHASTRHGRISFTIELQKIERDEVYDHEQEMIRLKVEVTKARCASCGHVQVFGELRGLLPVCEKCGGHVFTIVTEEEEAKKK